MVKMYLIYLNLFTGNLVPESKRGRAPAFSFGARYVILIFIY